jgi:hypothetical protein
MTKWAWIVGLALLATAIGMACTVGDDDDDDGGTYDDDDEDDDGDDDGGDDDAADDDAGDDSGDDDSGGGPPDYSTNHKPSWNCYVCHESDFNGTPGEPHGHGYVAPDQCVTCHAMGDQPNPPHGPAPHNLDQDCLGCHSGKHGRPWQEKDQCLLCHQPGGGDDDTGDDDTGSDAPTYPDNHDPSWNCYLCHDGPFNGSPAEPHGHTYDAPADCVGCHAEGAWTNGPHGPSGHNYLFNCLNCHGDEHGKDWQAKGQCVVCHHRGGSGGDDD